MKKEYDTGLLDDIYSDSAILGRKLAEDCEWDGVKILEAAANALIDANFDTEAAKIRQILEEFCL